MSVAAEWQGAEENSVESERLWHGCPVIAIATPGTMVHGAKQTA